MSKVMIVEDDDSLREIYAIRLTAEGYVVVSARDGEEALAVAVKERPDLIVSDVMMPKISGFDMLDILRSTPETKNIRVIMMTALSSEDQRVRGENLGADRYIVKSQVGIEDVVNVVHEVLGDQDPNSGTIDTQAPVEVPALQATEIQMKNTQSAPGAEVAAPAAPEAAVAANNEARLEQTGTNVAAEVNIGNSTPQMPTQAGIAPNPAPAAQATYVPPQIMPPTSISPVNVSAQPQVAAISAETPQQVAMSSMSTTPTEAPQQVMPPITPEPQSTPIPPQVMPNV